MIILKAVIFDMDGVIFDSESTNLACWNIVADKYGFEHPETPYRLTIGVKADRAKEIYLDYYGEDFPYDRYSAEKSRIFHSRYDGGNLPVKAGAAELLGWLNDEGWYVALASSTRTVNVVSQIADAGLTRYFDRIVGGDDIVNGKPALDIFFKAAENVDTVPDKIFVIEDSYNGIRAAYNAGMIPVMVPDMLPPDDEMRQKAAYIFDSLTEVRDFFENYAGKELCGV